MVPGPTTRRKQVDTWTELAWHTVEYVVTTPVTCYVCEVTPATRLDIDLKYRPICDACYRPYAQLPA